MKLENIYLQSPVFVQQLLTNLQGQKIKTQRYNQEFYDIYNAYISAQPISVQINDFRNFLKIAYCTPYWKNIFEQYQFDFNKNDILAELKKLPILTKNIVKDNYKNICNYSTGEDYISHKTSGTTGSGLVFPYTKRMEHHQWAVWWRYRNWHGININTWMGWFGGRSIANIKQTKPPYWRVSYPTKQVFFSAHHLTLDTVESYYYEIVSRKLSWLHGYPSQLSLLSSLLKKAGINSIDCIKHITVGAENLLENQRSIIEDVFKVNVVQNYGLAEGVANFSQDINGSLVPDMDFAYTEFIPLNPSDPSKCRIVGTGYRNNAFPLIRYDTGDIADVKWLKDGTPVIKSVDGRQEDYITLKNGVKLGRLDHIFKDIVEVDEAQIEQVSQDNINLNIVKGAGYKETMYEKLIIEEAKKRFGEVIKIKINYMSSIPRSKTGKFSFVISRVK